MAGVELRSLRADYNKRVLPSTNCVVTGVDCIFLVRTKQGTSCSNPNQALNIRGGGCGDRTTQKSSEPQKNN